MNPDALAQFIDEARHSGGSELANAQIFLERLCRVLGLPVPDMARPETRHNDYVFERAVEFRHADGSSTSGRIDLYKRGCFVLEAKQAVARADPDHPWMKAAGKAAVRIAMTVAAPGAGEGTLATVVAEGALDSDTPQVELRKTQGVITAKLTLGADVTRMRPLWANEGLSSPGVKLHGAGFIVTPQQARALGLGTVPGLEAHIRPYRNGRDLAQRPRGVMVIDLFGLTADEVRARFPAVYQHVHERVKAERDVNNRAQYRDNWWVFGEPRSDLRPALAGLGRYIATVETTKHRVFQFLDGAILPDNMLVAIALDNPALLAVLSSRVHAGFAIATGGWLGVGNDPRYSKSRTFDPFPFPDLSARPDLRARLAALGEQLDAFRKERLAAHPHLTLTGLYNALERLREADAGAGEPLSDPERDAIAAGRVRVLATLHDDIDRAVLEACGWSDLAPALVGRPGATLPSPHKTAPQDAAEDELLRRLVALNQARAAAEARGDIAWLRPDHQRARLAGRYPQPARATQVEADLAAAARADRQPWPADSLAQIRLLRGALRAANGPATAAALSAHFSGGRKREDRIERLLRDMVELGIARPAQTGGVFLPGQ